MNELQIFENEEFGRIRVIDIDGEPWAVGKDVANCLGYTNPSKALIDHVDEEDKLNNESLSSLGQRGGWLINESGIYSLVMSSRLPSAKTFKRWVTKEVLPSIRKTGQYVLAKPDSYMIEDPIERAKRWIEEEEVRQQLLLENETMKPKANYFDALVDRNLLTNFRTTAKEIGTSQKELINWLIENRYIFRDVKGNLQPYMHHVEAGLFEVKDVYNGKNGWSGTQTLFTPKGKETVRLLHGAS